VSYAAVIARSFSGSMGSGSVPPSRQISRCLAAEGEGRTKSKNASSAASKVSNSPSWFRVTRSSRMYSGSDDIVLTLNHAREQQFRRCPHGQVRATSRRRPHDSLSPEITGRDGISEAELPTDLGSSVGGSIEGDADAPEEPAPVVRLAEGLVGAEVVERRRAASDDAVDEAVERRAVVDEVERVGARDTTRVEQPAFRGARW
jgi:hypothetical protein